MFTEFDTSNLKHAPICKHCQLIDFDDNDDVKSTYSNFKIDTYGIENLINRTCLDNKEDSTYFYPNHTLFKNDKNPNLISHHGLLKREDTLLDWVSHNCSKCQRPIAAYFYFYFLNSENDHAKFLHYSHSMENIDEEYRNIWLVACQMIEYFKQKGYTTHLVVPAKNTTSLLYLMNASESIGQYEMSIDPVIYDE